MEVKFLKIISIKREFIKYFSFSFLQIFFIFSLCFLSFSFVFINKVFAGNEGTIDSNYKYAWGENTGWVNFGCFYCNVRVSDERLTGYAWSENYGWINLSPTNGGVRNDGNGNLSGYAWGENLGWIDFSNVKIDPNTGKFSGYAIILGGPGGKINFDCSNCTVITSWRKVSEERGLGGGGGGGGFVSFQTTTLQETKEINLISLISNLIEKITKPKRETKPPTTPPFLKPYIPTPKVEITPKLEELFVSPLNLPEPLKTLAERVEKFRQKLERIGLRQYEDIKKFVGIKLNVPTLSEILNITKNLSSSYILKAYKEFIPSDVLIIKSKSKILDIPIYVNINSQENITLDIKTLKNETLELIYKPSAEVKSIKGYLIYKGRRELSFFDKLENFYFRLTANIQGLNISEKGLILKEFDFEDKFKTGVYLAEVHIPNKVGIYQIKTIANYKELPPKETKVETFVDPSGYVYESVLGKEIRVEGAKVFLYWFNPKNNKIELWPAKEYLQENPQVTNKSGEYSFLVPPGKYLIKVEKEGYLPYQSTVLDIKDSDYINFAIELKHKRVFFLSLIDWKIVLIILLGAIILWLTVRRKKQEE